MGNQVSQFDIIFFYNKQVYLLYCISNQYTYLYQFYFYLGRLIIACWRRGSHDWNTLIGTGQLTNTIKDCQRLCQQTNTPDCEYFTYNPSDKNCFAQTTSLKFNNVKLHTDSAKDLISGTKRCKNGNYQQNNLSFIVVQTYPTLFIMLLCF